MGRGRKHKRTRIGKKKLGAELLGDTVGEDGTDFATGRLLVFGEVAPEGEPLPAPVAGERLHTWKGRLVYCGRTVPT